MLHAGQDVIANSNGKKGFLIPVSWEVSDFVRVQANTLEEAYDWIKEHSDEIPLGTDPDYVDSSYQVGEFEECKSYLDEAVEYTSVYKRKAINIVWDVDKGDEGLPSSLPSTVEIPETVDSDDIADYLSDCYGYLVASFEEVHCLSNFDMTEQAENHNPPEEEMEL